MHLRHFTALILSLLVLTAAGPADRFDADLVIHNGRIHTMDDALPQAGVVAVKDGRIVFVGTDGDASRWLGRSERVLDLKGRTMTPGLIDSHVHMLALGRAKMVLDVGEARNYTELIELVKAAAEKTPKGEWIIGRGWHQSKWRPAPEPVIKGFQTHDALSAAVPDHPVFLSHASGHAGFANEKAMQVAGIDRGGQAVSGGEVIRDDTGRPTGIFVEEAQALIRSHIPDPSPDRNPRALDLAMETALANGITSVRDAFVSADNLELFEQYDQSRRLKLRFYLMLDGSDEALLSRWYARGPMTESGSRFLTIRAIKLFADGALGSRGAWLLAPYSDRPAHTGHSTIDVELIHRRAREALAHGFQLCVHAIGDRANRVVLNQFQRAFEENHEAAHDHRFRIEHAQHVSGADIPRFAELGVIASMQTIHLSSDRPWAIDRLGVARIEEGAYAWQKLLSAGAVVVNGTDAPVEPIDPVAAYYAAVTRKTLSGHPPGGYESDQKMTRRQALRAYTLDGAYAGFEESVAGSISVGKYADFTVFSDDLLTVPEDRLLDVQVMMTIVNGRIAFERKG